MSEERLKARLAELKQKKEEHGQWMVLLDGAIQDCEYWLTELTKKDKANAKEAQKA